MHDLPLYKATAPSRATPSASRRVLANLILFQVGWFAAVLGAAHGTAWLGPVVIAATLGVHLYRASEPTVEARLILAALGLGLAFEYGLAATGWVAYPGHDSTSPPPWMIALWANFAATLNVSLRSLRSRARLLAMLGLAGGPLAYWGGVGLGAMTWLEAGPVVAYLAVGWGVLAPLMGRVALHWDGYRHAS